MHYSERSREPGLRTQPGDEGQELQVLEGGAGAHEDQVQAAVRQVRIARQPRRAHVAAGALRVL